MSSPVFPLSVSTRLPTVEELQTQIQQFREQLSVYANKSGIWAFSQRGRLQKQIADKQKQLDQLQHPSDLSGVPPAPDANPVLGPRIETPKVGFGDLKINLPGGY